MGLGRGGELGEERGARKEMVAVSRAHVGADQHPSRSEPLEGFKQ